MTTTPIAILVTAAALMTPSAVVHAQRQTAVTEPTGSKLPISRSEKENAMAEAQIRQRVEELVKAVRTKDLDAIRTLYAPDLVSFDVGPLLRYIGADNKRRAWQEGFAAFPGTVGYEVRDLSVTTQGELAFVHSLNYSSFTAPDGRTIGLWVRWTACFRRIDGAWLIVHDHVSVPAEFKTGRALMNLTP
jgi:ketosteroid isomerase-like protein